jgi:uncharacterized protein involved in exopolysaccharide biosynthesis
MNAENTAHISNKAADEISLKELITKMREWSRYFLSKWVIILCFGLIGGLLGLAYAYSKKKMYMASTTFVLEEDKGGGGLGSLAGLASMAGVDISTGGGIFQGDNILQLYKSRNMIQKTLLTTIRYDGKEQLLVDRFVEFNKLREVWAEEPEMKNISFVKNKKQDFTRLQNRILGNIAEEINAKYLKVTKPDKKLSIINVEVIAEDEFFAKEFNQQIVKNVNDFYVQTKTKKSLENVKILQQKVDSVRSVMSGAIYYAAKVSDATPNLNPTRQIQRSAPIQRSQFSAETNKSILTELVKNLEMSKISLRKETPLIQVIDEPIFPLQAGSASKKMFFLLGGFVATFLVILFLIVKKILADI